MSGKILVIDDDLNIRRSVEKVLRREGYVTVTATGGSSGVRAAERDSFDAVITDLVMDDMDGMAVLKAIKSIDRSVEVVMVTGHGTVGRAVEAMRLGAYDFLIKPITREELLKSVSKALEKRALVIENRRLSREVRERGEFHNIVGASGAIREVIDVINQVACTQATVLLEGESGTGKELVARAIHAHSDRCDRSFVPISCGALPETLLEAELFGAVKGAYTGAHEDRPGRFEIAHKGTLFLDEVAEMSPGAQVKLLRVLQDGEFQPLGSTETRKVDARVVAATNCHLESHVQEEKFRGDLYFRLNVVRILVPPLRERVEDIPLLANHFLRVFGESYGKKDLRFTEPALDVLTQYSWPGNVRELENTLERAVVFTRTDVVEVENLPPEVSQFKPEARRTEGGLFIPHGMTLDEASGMIIRETLARHEGDKRKTARALGIGLRTVYRRLEAEGKSSSRHILTAD